jgi:thiamine biosynthesis lipoprotein
MDSLIVKIKMRFTILLLLVNIIVFSFRNKEEKPYYIKGAAQGTTYQVSYWASDSLVSKVETDSVLSILDQSLSIYKPGSLINAFNDDSSGIEADVHLRNVVRKALEIYKATDGKFDITVYPLVTAWGFGSEKIKSLPDSAKIKSLLPLIGSDKLTFSGNLLIKKIPGLKIDVNGIAQGYSVDVLCEFLKEKGIKNYLVEIGGELRASGKKPNGQGMRIGIESPAINQQDEPIISKIITINELAVTTSGNYRKYVESGKKRIFHLIDPKTGYPIQSQMISATVIAKDAITADGYDNALMAMKVDEALNFAKSKGLEAYLIYHLPNGKLADTATTGFYKLQQILK